MFFEVVFHIFSFCYRVKFLWSQDLLSFWKKKVTKKNCSPFKSFRFLKPDAVTAPAAPLTVVARRAYPSPLKAARPSTDSLRSPTPGRLASRRSLLGNFLPALTSLTLVNRSLLAALTALYLLRENLYLFLLSDFAKQKTKVTQEFFENDEGVPPSPEAMAGQGRGRRKNFFAKKFFLLPLPCPAIASGDGGTPSSFSKNSCVTFVFCFAKSESRNRYKFSRSK